MTRQWTARSNLMGARFDDLSLKNYRQTPQKGSPEVTLLTPQAAKGAYDSYFGWENVANGDDLVGARTEWTAPKAPASRPIRGRAHLRRARRSDIHAHDHDRRQLHVHDRRCGAQ
ncbi:MAG: YidC/Oxa1 family insertase periplasmic-domain containing protein [Alphaproteobacteria bacterium]